MHSVNKICVIVDMRQVMGVLIASCNWIQFIYAEAGSEGEMGYIC